MLRLLIVDDEEKVCQLIEYILDWHSYGIDIVGIANDGETAYSKILELKPDIVITDIRMPKYDGIELIKKTKEHSLDISFIIISGYSHFEYAHNAIKYGVVNYLLKPIKEKELKTTIEKILKKHKTKAALEDAHKKLKNYIEISEKNNRNNFIRDFAFEQYQDIVNASGGTDLSDINSKYACNFQSGEFLILVLRPFLPLDSSDIEMWNLLLTKISSIAEDRLQTSTLERVSLVREREIIYFLNINTDLFPGIKKSLQGMSMDFSALTDIFEDVHVLIGISDITPDIIGLKELYNQASTAILNRFISRDPVLRLNFDISDINKKTFLDKHFRNLLLSDFERLDPEQILNHISEVLDFIRNKNLNGPEIQKCYNELIECIEFGINTYLPSHSFPDENFFLAKFQNIFKLNDIFSWLNNYLKETFNNYFNDKKESQSRPIRYAKKHIYTFYNTNISLKSISEEIGLNPSYFSSLFKKETGENFMDYLINVRVDYAKQYLTQTDLDIYDIAGKVGYTDVKYFTKIFKRQVHLTPLEYRKMYG